MTVLPDSLSTLGSTTPSTRQAHAPTHSYSHADAYIHAVPATGGLRHAYAHLTTFAYRNPNAYTLSGAWAVLIASAALLRI